MKRPGWLLCILVLCPAMAATAEPLAIVGGTVYTMTAEAPLKAATVVVRDGRIVAVGEDVEAPADARVIDARGRVVTPALMNSATQLGLTGIASVPPTVDHELTGGDLGAAFDVRYGIDHNSVAIRQAGADGLSRAISFPTASRQSPFSGAGVLLRLAAGGPVIQVAPIAMFAEIGGPSSERGSGSRSAQWQMLRYQLEEADLLSGRPRAGSPRDSRFDRRDLLALKPVMDGRLPLVIAVDRESDIRQAIDVAGEFDVRVIIRGGAEAWRVADELSSAAIPVLLDPSINLPLHFDQVGIRSDNAAVLDAAGVRIAFHASSIHTNYNAGFALREAAGLAVAAGLDHVAALRALTVNPGGIWGISNDYGAIAAGMDADLVVWDGDPLEPLTLPVAVVLGGEEVEAPTRQQMLRDRYAPDALRQSWPPPYR